MASILGDVALPRARIYTIIDLCWEKKNIELNKETSFLYKKSISLSSSKDALKPRLVLGRVFL